MPTLAKSESGSRQFPAYRAPGRFSRLVLLVLIGAFAGSTYFLLSTVETKKLPDNPDFQAYVTVLTSDEYLIGAKVLAFSLRLVGATRKFVVMVTPAVSAASRAALTAMGVALIEIEVIGNPNGELSENRRWQHTYTKLTAWNLRYEKIVFLDSDCVVLQNIDHLFDLPVEEPVAAVLDCCERWNTGVFLTRPSKELFTDMIGKMASTESYDSADAGFLNEYFPLGRWHELAFRYNAQQDYYTFKRDAWKMSDIKVLHFTLNKPWKTSKEEAKKLGIVELHTKWWAIADLMQQSAAV